MCGITCYSDFYILWQTINAVKEKWNDESVAYIFFKKFVVNGLNGAN